MTIAAASHRPLASEAVWNFAALGLTTASGAILTFAIAGWRGADALGVFAQLYAVYVIGAQVAVFGAHDSVQKHAAEIDAHDTGAHAPLVSSALALVALTSMSLGLLIVATAEPAGRLVGSADVGRGLYLVAPGIVCLALNKVLFGALNGRGRLRTYAVMQMLRALLVLLALAGVLGFGLPDYTVGGILTAAELVLLPFLVVAVRPSWTRARDAAEGGVWWRRHLTFGGLGLVNGILLETHLRVDVITLSYFVSDSAVGVYAFAALFAEGLYQVAIVVRTVAYPRIVRLASRRDLGSLARLARRLAIASGGLTAVVATAVALLYPAIGRSFNPDYVTLGFPVLQVLLVAMTLHACVVPVDQLLLQSGFPGRQSVLMASYVAANVGLNVLLIPSYGLMGAAAATAAALVIAAALLLAASWLWLGYRGGVLLHRVQAA
jgi:O-antigen/teichoic acid export membrane protein